MSVLLYKRSEPLENKALRAAARLLAEDVVSDLIAGVTVGLVGRDPASGYSHRASGWRDRLAVGRIEIPDR